jgi:hypothetical protein
LHSTLSATKSVSARSLRRRRQPKADWRGVVKRLIVALCFGAAGCLTPTQRWQRIDNADSAGGTPETAYLLRIDPATVQSGGPASLARWAAELERRYVRDVEVEGIVWEPLRSTSSRAEPDRYGSGGDSLLFSAIALAGWTW